MTLYERLGGHDPLERIVYGVYDLMKADADLGPLFDRFARSAATLKKLKERTVDFLAGEWGGEKYDGPDLYIAHSTMNISADLYDGMLRMYVKMLEKENVEQKICEEVMESLERLREPIVDPDGTQAQKFNDRMEALSAEREARVSFYKANGIKYSPLSGQALDPEAVAKAKAKARAKNETKRKDRLSTDSDKAGRKTMCIKSSEVVTGGAAKKGSTKATRTRDNGAGVGLTEAELAFAATDNPRVEDTRNTDGAVEALLLPGEVPQDTTLDVDVAAETIGKDGASPNPVYDHKVTSEEDPVAAAAEEASPGDANYGEIARVSSQGAHDELDDQLRHEFPPNDDLQDRYAETSCSFASLLLWGQCTMASRAVSH